MDDRVALAFEQLRDVEDQHDTPVPHDRGAGDRCLSTDERAVQGLDDHLLLATQAVHHDADTLVSSAQYDRVALPASGEAGWPSSCGKSRSGTMRLADAQRAGR